MSTDRLLWTMKELRIAREKLSRARSEDMRQYWAEKVARLQPLVYCQEEYREPLGYITRFGANGELVRETVYADR